MQQSYPPTMDRVEKEIAFHLEKNNTLAPAFAVYKSILAVQLKYLDKVEVAGKKSADEIKDCFRNEKYLLAEQKPVLDGVLFREVLASVAGAIREASPEAPEALRNLPELDEFNADNIDEFIQQVICFNKQEMEAFIEKKEMDKRAALDSEVIAFVIFMSLSPFISRMMQEVEAGVGFSLWRQGYCPICGQTAFMAKHRSEDGARVLECWLCHAQWVFPRLECPYCDNKEQKKLRFFYVPGDKSRQVHVCEECKSYLKTVDAKAMQKDVILEVEGIATGRLDLLAEQEGYRPPARAPLLH
ncbi:MAG: formate dehydrogenase accessory protein FdhE [Bacillota bacterium]